MYLLDTNICIYIIKKKPPSVLQKLKERLNKSIFVSAITLAELEYGIEKSRFPGRNRVALIEFLSIFSVLDFCDRDAIEFGKIKVALEARGQLIGPMDLLLAAQARANRLILVSNNLREFRRVDELQLENWV